MLIRSTVAVATLICILVPHASAGIIVEVQNAQIVSGGTGFVDVFIRSDSTDNLAAFDYEFQITDVGVPVGDLRFQSSQSLAESGDGSYVFFGDSGDIRSIPQNSPAFDRITGGDFTDSFGDVGLTTTNLLMARLDIEHILPGGTPLSAGDGDQFTISLLSSGNTFFFDSIGDPVPLADDFSGIVTVQFSAVPEPGSLGVMLLLTGFGCLCRRRR